MNATQHRVAGKPAGCRVKKPGEEALHRDGIQVDPRVAQGQPTLLVGCLKRLIITLQSDEVKSGVESAQCGACSKRVEDRLGVEKIAGD